MRLRRGRHGAGGDEVILGHAKVEASVQLLEPSAHTRKCACGATVVGEVFTPAVTCVEIAILRKRNP